MSKSVDLRALLVGMVVFDLFLHLYQIISGSFFITFDANNYDLFWTGYWSLFLIMLMYQFRQVHLPW